MRFLTDVMPLQNEKNQKNQKKLKKVVDILSRLIYNSICVNAAIWHSEEFKKHKAIRYGSAVLMVLIILSTMFLKQHSVFDVVTGTVLAVFMYSLVYNTNLSFVLAERPVRNPRRI